MGTKLAPNLPKKTKLEDDCLKTASEPNPSVKGVGDLGENRISNNFCRIFVLVIKNTSRFRFPMLDSSIKRFCLQPKLLPPNKH